jgi:hypothetical protein
MPELRQPDAVLAINSQVGASRSPHVRVQGMRRCVDGSRQQPRRAGRGLDMRVDTICTDQLAGYRIHDIEAFVSLSPS